MANNIVINVIISSLPPTARPVRLCSLLDVCCNALLVASRRGRAKAGLQIRSRRSKLIRNVGREVKRSEGIESIGGVIGVEINQVTKRKSCVIDRSALYTRRGRPVFKELKIWLRGVRTIEEAVESIAAKRRCTIEIRRK